MHGDRTKGYASVLTEDGTDFTKIKIKTKDELKADGFGFDDV